MTDPTVKNHDTIHPEGNQSLPRLWTKNFLLIIFANLCVFLSFHMLLPTIPLYVQYLGAGEDMVGLVIGILTITAVAVRPLAGLALDTKGRKAVYFGGLIIITLSIAAYSLVPTVALLLVLRFVHGVGWGTGSTAAGTIASDIIPKARLGEGMGYYGLTSVLSMAIAPAIGLQIIAQWGFDNLFYCSTAFVLLGILFAVFLTYQQMPAAIPAHAEATKPKPALFEKSAYKPSLIVFFLALTYGSVVSFIALYAAQFGITNIGVFFTTYALTLLFSRPYFGRMADKKGFDFAMIPGIFFIGLTMVILYFAQNLAFFIIAAICYGIGFGASQPSLQAMAVYNVPPQRRGAANGTFLSGFDLGIGVGSIIWGYVAKITSYSTMYLLTVIPVIAGFVFYFLFYKKSPHAKKPA